MWQFRAYFWLCNRGSFLVELWGSYEGLEIEPDLAVYKAKSLSIIQPQFVYIDQILWCSKFISGSRITPDGA